MLRGVAFHTPLGALVGLTSETGLRRLSFDLSDLAEAEQAPSPTLDLLARWLDAYFRREFRRLPELPLDLPQTPSTDVWLKTSEIPVGAQWTYGELARQMGRSESSARAVGAAMAANPLLLVLPCHRVLAQSGSLAGYRGGVQRKAWLLKHEGTLLL
jgi:methylated-DNA-[protein]-cysteine S-methyltransferase